MHSYRVVTVQRAVYVHNVDSVDVVDDMTGDDPKHDNRMLVFHRRGSSEVRFPLANVVSYEVTT